MSAGPGLIVAIDQGTTSSRVLIFDAQGHVVSSAQREFEQIFPRSGWVEHRPRDILTSVQVTLAEAMHHANLDASAVAGIGITNQRETTVVWDRKTGEPVYNALVWQSRHSAELCRDMRSEAVDALVRERTGLLLDAYFSATKLAWLFRHVDGVRERAQRGELLFGTIDSWLVWNLTGGKVHVTDVSNASRTLLYNIHKQCWDEDLLALFGVPASMLPEVRGCSEIYGRIEPKYFFGRDVPICGIAGDQQAALFGQACFEPGMAKNTYGTGCFMLMNTGTVAVPSQRGLLSTVAWKVDGQMEYALEGSVFVAGAVVQWLRDGLRMLDNAAESQACAESVWRDVWIVARHSQGASGARGTGGDGVPDPRRTGGDGSRCRHNAQRVARRWWRHRQRFFGPVPERHPKCASSAPKDRRNDRAGCSLSGGPGGRRMGQP